MSSWRARLAALALVAPAGVQAQAPAAPAPAVTLQQAYRAAAAADPRMRQLALEAEQTALRLRAIEAARLPSLRLDAKAQHQSDVPTFNGPGGTPFALPPKNTVDASVGIQQRLLDPSIAARAAVERAGLEEARARIAVSLYGLRQEVDEAFFAALTAAARAGAIDVRLAALDTLQRTAGARGREGAALPSEPRAIAAVILQRRQDRLQAAARRGAALDRLARLTGGLVSRDSALVIPPALGAELAGARAGLGVLRARPEYEAFEKSRERLARQQDAVAVENRPRVSAFARAGYGRPGLNFISDEFDAYWMGGLELQWMPWSWGAREREHDALGLEREIIAADAAAFSERLARALDADLAEVDRLEASLVLDNEIVALRRQIEREAFIRWEARVIALAEYLDRSGELLDAEVARDERRIALDAARARVLTAAGVEVR
jgi:outer membrane protein TolC